MHNTGFRSASSASGSSRTTGAWASSPTTATTPRSSATTATARSASASSSRTKPGGKDSDFTVALAGDLVYRDQNARLTRGQQAFQGVLAAFWEHDYNRLGVFTTLRHQQNDQTSGSDLFPYTDTIDALAVDVHGRLAVPVPGQDAFLFAEAEAAYIAGSTNILRTAEQALDGSKTSIRSYGGAARRRHRAPQLGDRRVGGRRSGERGTHDESAKATSLHYLGKPSARGVPYGDLVAQVELGYASGDADPYDGTQRRFVFDPNHRVGLILFDEVMRWQTARSATAATDPLLTNATRPTPGVDLLPSNGGVFGAQYVNPTFIYRPRHFIDLKGGMVIAQSTADVVDPYRLATQGSYVNYRGGDRRKKDLGVELDAGFEARFPLDYDLKAVVGAQAGLLLPGGALENADGVRMPPQWIAIGRLGLSSSSSTGESGANDGHGEEPLPHVSLVVSMFGVTALSGACGVDTAPDGLRATPAGDGPS